MTEIASADLQVGDVYINTYGNKRVVVQVGGEREGEPCVWVIPFGQVDSGRVARDGGNRLYRRHAAPSVTLIGRGGRELSGTVLSA